MSAYYAIVAGNNNVASTWSLTSGGAGGAGVPGAGDAVHLNGFLVTQVAPWSIANIYDDGLAGSGIFNGTSGANITVSGAINSTVTATQLNGNNNGTTKPTLYLANTNIGSVNVGSISSTGGSCGMAFMYPSFPITVGTITATGNGLSAPPSVGLKCYYSGGCTLTLGSGTATAGAHCLDLDGPNGYNNVSFMVVNCSGGIAASGYNPANNLQSTGVAGGCTFNGNISSSGNSECFSAGPFLIYGNVSSVNALISGYAPFNNFIYGKVLASGNGAIGGTNALRSTNLFASEVSLSNGAILLLDQEQILYAEKFTNDGTGVINNSGSEYYFFHTGPALGYTGAIEIIIPQASQVQNGINYGLALTGTYSGGKRVIF